MEEYKRFPLLTADQLQARTERPKRVKMYTRDFIEDSLYNPSYGYFAKHAVIFRPGEPFDFRSMKDEPEFQHLLRKRYAEFEDELDKKHPMDTRQLWHTPTELFSPYYGESLARYMMNNYTLHTYPHHDLIIYEMGAGNGTLMLDILDYLRDVDDSVYKRTKYKIIEISSSLASQQMQTLMGSAASRGHKSKVEIINKSIFTWHKPVPEPCYFLAMEVFDNFAHDAIRYDPVTERPLQGTVLIDRHGDFYEFYLPEIDAVARRFLRLREAYCDSTLYPHPLAGNRFIKNLKRKLPFMPNLSDTEYIPTRLMQFFDVLGRYFPGHRLLSSDFNYLPGTIRGVNAPVVQTRYKRNTVPVTTPLVQQGYFDILFPTNFYIAENMYKAITGKLTSCLSQEEFLKRWADVEKTEMMSGENPLLSWYGNASVMLTL